MRPRLGLAVLTSDRLAASEGPSFRVETELRAGAAAQVLAGLAEVDYPGPLGNDADARAAADRWANGAIDGLVLFPEVASPPSIGWTVAAPATVPLLVWNVLPLESIPASLTYAGVVRNSATVGAAMLTNVLRREGRAFHHVSGPIRDPDLLARVTGWLAAFTPAERLRSCRLGRLGHEIPGYLDVTLDAAEVRTRLGLEVVDLSRAELADACRSVDAARIEAELASLVARCSLDIRNGATAQSIAVALGLEDLVRARRIDAVALNCHSDFFRDNPEVGVVACYGAARLTGMGIPVACTGDLTAAVAMLALEMLELPAHYCEGVALDLSRDHLLLTNTGEGDPRLARSGPPCLDANIRFPGVRGAGTKVRFECREGPATLLAFTPHPGSPGGHLFVTAAGCVLPDSYPGTGVASAAFRFRGVGCREGFERWCLAGAPHHAALTSGDVTDRIRALAAVWGVGAALV